MRFLLGTGILLRLVNREAAAHTQVRQAVRILKLQGHNLFISFQNISEFWNVCTRPTDARGGFGLTIEQTRRRLRTIERILARIPDSAQTYTRWLDLVSAHEVKGVQVHDAKLVALMGVWGVTHLLTLNASDFARYSAIVVLTPEQVIANEATKPDQGH